MKAAIYAWVSTKDQDNEHQLQALRAFAAGQGYEVYQEYTDLESGGKAGRLQQLQLFQDAHQHQFEVALFWSLDRFSRDGVVATLLALQQLSASDVAFRSYTEPYLDSTGIFKEAMGSILAALARQEQLRVGQQRKASLRQAREPAPLVEPPEVGPEMVAQIRLLKEGGASHRRIGQAMGLPTKAVAKYARQEKSPDQ